MNIKRKQPGLTVLAMSLAMLVGCDGNGDADGRKGAAGSGGHGTKNAMGKAPDLTGVSWANQRGNTGMTGRADGTLPDNLTQLWRYRFPKPDKGLAPAVTGAAAIADGIVYVGTDDGKVAALDLLTGEEQWKITVSGEGIAALHRGPAIAGDRLIALSADGTLFGIKRGDGAVQWTYSTGHATEASVNVIKSPEGKTYWAMFGGDDNILHCVNTADGKRVWMYEIEEFIRTGAGVENGIVALGGCDQIVHFVDVSNGKAKKEIGADGQISSAVAMEGGIAYSGNHTTFFSATSFEQGKVLWSFQAEGEVRSPGAIGDRLVVFGSKDMNVYAVDKKSGKQAWSFATRDDVNNGPVIVGDKVVIAGYDGRLYVLSLDDGKKLQEIELGGALAAPAVAHGIVVVGSDDGFVYAYGGKR